MTMSPTSLTVLIFMVFIAVVLYIKIASLPGNTARSRNHPQAEAISVLGWLGLLFGGVGWVVAMVWAYMKPIFPPAAPATTTGEEGSAKGGAGEKAS